MKKTKKLLLLFVYCILLMSCGGGGGSSEVSGVPAVDDSEFTIGVLMDADTYTGTDKEKLQKAITDAETKYNIILISRKYIVDGTLTITKSIHVMGATKETSQIISNNPDEHILIIASDESVVLEDIGIFYNVKPADEKACIYVTDADGDSGNFNSIFSRLLVDRGYYNFHFVRAHAWIIEDCYIANPYKDGILIENQQNPDYGDSQIKGSMITGSNTEARSLIHWLSSGGLRIENNKLISYTEYGILIEPTYEGTTCDLFIVGNSIEGKHKADISMDSGNGKLLYVLISNNQMGGGETSAGIVQNGGNLYDLMITNNIIGLAQAGSVGISINGATGIIDGNEINMWSGANTVGINLNGKNTMKMGTNNIVNSSVEIR